MSPHPYLDASGPIAFAHRGGGLEAPENTLASFEHSVRLGYRYIETDVHATRDGVLLVFHDETMDRLTGRQGTPGDFRWDELTDARINGAEPIPLLEEVMERFAGVRFNIDPKTDAAADALAAYLERTGAFDRVCVGSFSDTRLSRLRRRLGPRLCTSPGPLGVTRVWLRGHGLPVPGPAANCLQVPPRQFGLPLVFPGFIRAARVLGLPVHVWTIDEEVEMERLLDMGVDGIMTDRPSLLKAVLERRGQWRE